MAWRGFDGDWRLDVNFEVYIPQIFILQIYILQTFEVSIHPTDLVTLGFINS